MRAGASLALQTVHLILQSIYSLFSLPEVFSQAVIGDLQFTASRLGYYVVLRDVRGGSEQCEGER